MKKKYIIILGIISLVLIGTFTYRFYDYYHVREYESVVIEAEDEDKLSGPPKIIENSNPDVITKAPKKEYSKNKIGWLKIDGLEIDSPVVKYKDNDRYLRYNEYDEYDVWGAYYVNADNDISDVYNLDKVTTIFGHSNGQATSPKFAALKLLKKPKIAESVRTIEFYIDDIKTTWRIFAVGDYPVNNNYLVPNPSDETFSWQIEEMKKASYNTYNIDISNMDKVLILSTCTSTTEFDTRYIVCAKLISIG